MKNSRLFFLIVKKKLINCEMDFKQRVPMVLSEDVLDVLMGSLLKSSVPPRKNVGMLPIHITLDIIVAMV